MNLRRFPLRDGEPTQNGGGQPPLDLAGYPDVQSLVNGYRNSSAEAKRWRDTAAGLLEQQLQGPRPDVPQRDVYGRLTESGLPADDLRMAIQQEVQSLFQPIARGFEARSQVLSQYSDYNKFEADVAGFINQDPSRQQAYQRMFAADPAAAMEWAFLKFGEDRRRTLPPQPNTGVDPQAQVQAQIPSSRNGDARAAGINPDQDVLQRAWDHYKNTKDPSAYALARIRQSIPDSFLNQGFQR